MVMTVLIANRGEIAIRIARSAAEMGLQTVAVCAADEVAASHVHRADRIHLLAGEGVAPYLDIAQLVSAARQTGCDALHPGYGLLSENPDLARACAAAGITFIGPEAEVLRRFGDKAAARALAAELGVPVLPGSDGAADLAAAREFMEALGPGAAVMVKAVAGGGGRGMRPVFALTELEAAFARCTSESQKAFGNGALYVEQFFPAARHIEVQVIGDGTGAVSHLWERDCSLQRQRQKLVEIAPAPDLAPALRQQLLDAACRMAAAVKYRGVGTFEFLVNVGDAPAGLPFVFIEANARLQVEHTVTEEILGLDLVRLQFELAAGRSLDELGLRQPQVPQPRGMAVQLRINSETLLADGSLWPGGGVVGSFDLAAGPGIRVDTAAHGGYAVHPAFDSLLAKLIVSIAASDPAALLRKAQRAVRECHITGVAHNLPLLQALLGHPDVLAGKWHTRLIEQTLPALLAAGATAGRPLHGGAAALTAPGGWAGMADPDAVTAPLAGRVVMYGCAAGDLVPRGQVVAVLESMKMEHEVRAPHAGRVRGLLAAVDDVVMEGQPLLLLDPADVADRHSEGETALDPDHIRPDLAEVIQRHALGLDAARPDAVARRRKTGQRTARENIAALCDPESFIEYGALAVAAQRQRRSLDDLVRNTPADGFITGIGSVNGALYPDEAARCAVMAYDFTVLAGTQGMMGHKKLDRLLDLATQWRLPTVLFAEGGGGRPGDSDANTPAGLDLFSFRRFAALSGEVPLLGIVSGRCFAGNAALLGCCDTIIATANSNIGMGGPAMIEGGGLGVYPPEAVGPADVQRRNGVIDIAVTDEVEAVAVARRYLGYFQGPVAEHDAADQRRLRSLVPENRLRVYDMRAVITTLADTGSVLELRRDFGVGMITALIRIGGRALGLIANDPQHLGGAIDAAGADKAARFLQLCAAHGLPILSLCDTPGFMVGPEIETQAQVRHVCRMFVGAAKLEVPLFALVLRKGYGLGAMAMTGGGFHASMFTAAWPTGEFGGMGLEGAVRLGYRKELEAAPDAAAREALFRELVARHYETGKATNMASYLEIDAVIDPTESRRWILRGLRSLPAAPPKSPRRFIDTW